MIYHPQNMRQQKYLSFYIFILPPGRKMALFSFPLWLRLLFFFKKNTNPLRPLTADSLLFPPFLITWTRTRTRTRKIIRTRPGPGPVQKSPDPYSLTVNKLYASQLQVTVKYDEVGCWFSNTFTIWKEKIFVPLCLKSSRSTSCRSCGEAQQARS